MEAQSRFRRYQHGPAMRTLVQWFLLATKWFPVWALRAASLPVVAGFILFSFKNYLYVYRNIRTIRAGSKRAARAPSQLLAAAMYKNFAYYLIDLFHASHGGGRVEKYNIEIIGIENIKEALKTGRGILLLTTHLGNWEMGGMALARFGIDARLNLVYSPDSSAPLETHRSRMREFGGGVREVPLEAGGFSSIKLLRLLEQGEIVAMQGDRLLFDTGMKGEFFGKEAVFPKGPIKLALLSGALVIPVFMPITGYKAYEVIIEGPIEMDPALKPEDNLRKITRVFERYVARYPTQWFNFMPFWTDEKKEPPAVEAKADIP